MTNRLYYGDNLDVLRNHIASESIDLVYLDPPFNSNANYNILFKSPTGKAADSQIEAFEDSWHWNDSAEAAFHDVMVSGNTNVAELLRAMRGFLKENDMMAYLAMMAVRLIELHRVLKPTGSLYLHCDPTASHYLKLLLDGVFGARMRGELIWKRSSAHNDGKQGSKQPGRIHDCIFFYTKTESWVWNPIYTVYDAEYLAAEYKRQNHEQRWYKETDLTAAKPGGDVSYDWRVKQAVGGSWESDLDDEWLSPKDAWQYKAVKPYDGRYWAYSKANLRAFAESGNLIHRSTGMPRLVQFADKMPGVALQDLWNDIPPISPKAQERLRYPTQKPLALLERIISASSNPGDIVLDPFCGCGTAVDAAQNLGRRWIGIDVTHLSIGLIERRMQERYGNTLQYEVIGTPNDTDSALKLAADEPHQFQYWITQAIGGQPFQGGRKGMDRGIDGYIYYSSTTDMDTKAGPKQRTDAAIISVKAGQRVGVAMVRDLKGVMEREKADIGIFVCVITPTREMEREAAAAGVFVDPGTGETYPRLQIYTLAEYFAGLRPKLPRLNRQAGYKKAGRADTTAGRQGNLL